MNNTDQTQRTRWFVAEILERPLSWNYNKTIRVGVEALDYEHAANRLRKLYPHSRYMSRGYSDPSVIGGLDKEPAKDTDDLNGANLHSLSTSL